MKRNSQRESDRSAVLDKSAKEVTFEQRVKWNGRGNHEDIRGKALGGRHFRSSKEDRKWILTCTMDFEIQPITEELCKSPFFKEPHTHPSSQRGLPDSADVGARVAPQGWHDPESTILAPHSCLFSHWDQPSRTISPPRQVDMGAGRGPQPVPHLGAPQDHRLPFHPEGGFEILAMKLAVSCSHWGTERNHSQALGPKPPFDGHIWESSVPQTKWSLPWGPHYPLLL